MGLDELAADAARGQNHRAAVVACAVHRDRQTDGPREIPLNPFQDSVEQLAVSAGGVGTARMEDGGGHGASHSLVITVATRSRPEIPSRVAMCPVRLTTIVSSVVAASVNNARTAALSQ